MANKLKVWDGSSWIEIECPSNLKVFNGSSWQQVSKLKWYSGGWQTLLDPSWCATTTTTTADPGGGTGGTGGATTTTTTPAPTPVPDMYYMSVTCWSDTALIVKDPAQGFLGGATQSAPYPVFELVNGQCHEIVGAGSTDGSAWSGAGYVLSAAKDDCADCLGYTTTTTTTSTTTTTTTTTTTADPGGGTGGATTTTTPMP